MSKAIKTLAIATILAAVASAAFAQSPRDPYYPYYGNAHPTYPSPNLWTTSREGLVQAN